MEGKEEIVTLDLEDDDAPSKSVSSLENTTENLTVSAKSAAMDLPPPRTPELVPDEECKVESPASSAAAASDKDGHLCITEDTDKEDALLSSPAPLKITLKKRKKKTEVWTYKKQHRKSRKLLNGAQHTNNASLTNGDQDLPGAGTPPESADSENEKAEASEEDAVESEEKPLNSVKTAVTVSETVMEKSVTIESRKTTEIKIDGSCKRAHPNDKEGAEEMSPVESKKVKKEEIVVEEVEEISIIERKPTEVSTAKPAEEKIAPVTEEELVKKIEDKENFKEGTKIAHMIRKLSRKELEDLLLRKMLEVLSERSACVGFRRRAETGEKEISTLKSRLQQMQNQVSNLNTAIGRYLAESKQNKDKQPVLPVRITRSVALQVNLIPRPKSQSNHHNSTTPTKMVPSPTKSRPVLPTASPNASQPAKQVTYRRPPQAVQRPPSQSPVTSPPASKPVVPIRIAPQYTPKVPPSQTSFTHPAFAQVPPRGSNHNAASRSPVQQIYASVLAASAGNQKPAVVSNTPPNSVRSPTTQAVTAANLALNKSLLANLNAQMNPATQNKTPVTGSHSNITTVHKVTLPTAGGSSNRPKVIDLTGEESRAAQKAANQAVAQAVSSPKPNNSVATSIVYVQNSNGTAKRPMVTIPMPTTKVITPVSASLLLKRPIPSATIASTSSSPTSVASTAVSATPRHPAPLPLPAPYASNLSAKIPPCKPVLKISKVATGQGLVLSWTMQLTDKHANIETYQLYAYQEGSNPPSTALWKKVGDVKAMPLPMACTLTQFMEGFRYHFAVRAIDDVGREGPYSDPSSILLNHAK